MTQIIQLITIFSPFLPLAVFFRLYRKENNITMRFCWRMTMTFSARKLFIIVMLGSLVFLNWCCYQTGSNLAVLIAAFMTGCLVPHRVADAVLHRLHERTRLWALTLMLALLCYAIPYMNSVFQVLYTVGVASVFYPSERVLRMKDEVNAIGNPHGLLHRILHLYY